MWKIKDKAPSRSTGADVSVADTVSPLPPLPTAEEIALLAANPDADPIKVQQTVLALDRAELERLVASVIPERILDFLDRTDTAGARTFVLLRDCFDLAFCLADDSFKRQVATTFIAGAEKRGISDFFETALFRPKYLVYLEPGPRKRMTRHILNRLQAEMSLSALRLSDGIEEFLADDDDLFAWLTAVVIACLAAPADVAEEMRAYAKRAYARLRPEQKQLVSAKQEEVMRDCEAEGNYGLAHLIRSLHNEWTNPLAMAMKVA